MSTDSGKTQHRSQKSRLREQKKRKKAIVAFVIAAVVCAVALTAYFVPFRRMLPAYDITARREGELRLHFLDVGQGDCTLVEFPDGQVLVVDAGDGSFTYANKLVRYVKGLKPTSLTMLVTHADFDHYGGFEALLDVFGAEKFYLPLLPFKDDGYVSLLKRIGKADCETEILTRYGTIANSCGAYLVAISPYSIGETDDNDSSTVLYFSYGGVNALFCADISAAREKRLVNEYALDETLFDSGDYTVRLSGVDLLKVAHHASGSSSSAEWLNLLKPETAVISCGAGNAYAHPSGEALLRLKAEGAEIYRVDELGDIVVSIYDGNYTIGGRT